MTDWKIASQNRFGAEIVAEMLLAIDMDDVVDPIVHLPEPIPISCSQEDMARCFSLCLQLWQEGADRRVMQTLVRRLLARGDLTAKERADYKQIRALYKHLRFALALYSERHKPPLLFRVTVALMGHLQDSFRNGQRRAVMGYALLLLAMLCRPVWNIVRSEVRRTRLDSPAGFLAFRCREFARLRQWLGSATLTSHIFHSMRKIISRQVSFYDTRKTLRPDEEFYRMSRFLSAINGLMGQMHDDLVEERDGGSRNYHRDMVNVPFDIRHRLERVACAYPVEGMIGNSLS